MIIWKDVAYFCALLLGGSTAVVFLNSVIAFKPDEAVTPISYIIHVFLLMGFGAILMDRVKKLRFFKPKIPA